MEAEITQKLRGKGVDARCPQERRMIRRGGKWQEQLYTLFPSYIFVSTPDVYRVYYAVRDEDGVLPVSYTHLLLLGAWGLCLYITSRSLMDDARREEAVLHQPAEEFDDPDELPPLYWEGYDRGYEDALESMAYTRPPRVRPPKSKKKGA